MATIFSHAFLGYTISKVWHTRSPQPWLNPMAAICSMVPDADFAGWIMHVPYDSMWGHRGFTHSLFFAMILAAAVSVVYYFRGNPAASKIFLAAITIFVVTASHGVVDACTNGGLGVGFFIPFHNDRYFFPFRPLAVSPMGLGILSSYGLTVLKIEMLWINLPCMVVLIWHNFKMKKKRESLANTL